MSSKKNNLTFLLFILLISHTNLAIGKILKSSAAQISVAVSGTPALPYTLPAPGQSVLIGINSALDVKPATHDAGSWSYSLFGSYGGGTFVADYSALGAYVLAGTGGHNSPPNFGAAVFDFSDAKWKKIDNQNGMPWRINDITLAETSDGLEISLPGVTPFAMPAPTHTFNTSLALPAILGGGSKGSVINVFSTFATTAAYGSGRSHRFDLATGMWSRQSTNTSPVSNVYTASFDSIAKRYYVLPRNISSGGKEIAYLDVVDWTWKSASLGSYQSDDGDTRASFIDSSRRLLIALTSTGHLRAVDLTNISGGVKQLNVSGSLPNDDQIRWEYYPPNDSYYYYIGNGQILYHLTPPASGNALTGVWTVNQISITGASLPSDVAPIEHAGSGAVHNSRFFYVPAIKCLAWIAGGSNKVALIKPN